MKTEKRYANLESAETKAQAVEDCRFYLGDNWKKVTRTLKDITNPHGFQFGCMMVGIQGYPVVALYEHLTGLNFHEQMKEVKDEELHVN